MIDVVKAKVPSLPDNNLAILRVLNLTIKDVTEAIDNFHFNNAIASIRSLFNSLLSYKVSNINDEIVILHSTKNFLILINPMVPHLAEELWANLKNKKMICNETWPSVNNDFLLETNVEIPIQINGKMRALINVPIDTDKETLEKLALMEQNVKKFLNATPKKVIIIPNRIINFVL